jgi:uncharacterized membrane protein
VRLGDDFDLMLVIVATLLQLWLVLTGQGGVFRVALGFLFVVFMPGYSILSALYRPFREHGPIERVALAGAASLAISALSGLALDRLAISVRAEAFALWMSAAIALFAVTGVVRRELEGRSVPTATTRADDTAEDGSASSRPEQAGFAGGAMAAVLCLIAATALGLGFVAHSLVLVPPPAAGSVSLYVVDPSGRAHDYPHSVVRGAEVKLELGIAYHGGPPQEFELKGPDGNRTRLHLKPGESWKRVMSLNIDHLGGTRAQGQDAQDMLGLRWELYQAGADTPLRVVQVWVRIEGAQR